MVYNVLFIILAYRSMLLLRLSLKPNIFCVRKMNRVRERESPNKRWGKGKRESKLRCGFDLLYLIMLPWNRAVSERCNIPPPQQRHQVASDGSEAAFNRESDTMSSLQPKSTRKVLLSQFFWFNFVGARVLRSEARLAQAIVPYVDELLLLSATLPRMARPWTCQGRAFQDRRLLRWFLSVLVVLQPIVSAIAHSGSTNRELGEGPRKPLPQSRWPCQSSVRVPYP